MQLEEFVRKAIEDRFVGWELIELLDIPIEDVLPVALDEGWINDDNIKELLEAIGYVNDE